MLNRSELDQLARIARTLTDDPPDLAVSHVLQGLSAFGIEPAGARELDTETAWLAVSHASSSLTLRAPPTAPSTEFRDLLNLLLKLALAHRTDVEALQHERERSALLATVAFEGLLVHRVEHSRLVIDANEQLAQMFGYEVPELRQEGILRSCVAPEDIDLVSSLFTRCDGTACVVTAVRKDGTRFRAEVQAKRSLIGGREVRVLALRDVTERERIQALLSETEGRMRNLVEHTFDLTVFSRKGVIVDCAGSVERFLGYTRDAFIGRRIVDLVPRQVVDIVATAIAEERVGLYRAEALSAHGEAIPVEIVAVQSTMHGEPVRVAAMRDLRPAKRMENERLKLQQEIERSQRLESLGMLAGGIAHDFNNLLTGVLGYAELLRTRLPEADDQELVQGIVDAGQRAAGLTAQLLAYAGRKELGPRSPIELGALVRDLRALITATFPTRARVLISADEPCTVLGNRGTLTQVIMNLLSNAADALADQQQGQISVRVQGIDEPTVHFKELPPATAAGWVLLEVSDTGHGMDDATMARIFEPFFSTKPRGHGLGLAACAGIITSLAGTIRVDSTPGLGSTFSVLLPRASTADTDSAGAHRVAPRPLTDRRVLVVDDEPLVRGQLRHALTQRGCHVEEAQNGTEALARFERGDLAHPDLVVLDVTMPDLSGIEVLRRLRARGVETPIVLSSGYHDAALDIDPNSFQGFLIKPYTPSQLFETLGNAVSHAQPEQAHELT